LIGKVFSLLQFWRWLGTQLKIARRAQRGTGAAGHPDAEARQIAVLDPGNAGKCSLCGEILHCSSSGVPFLLQIVII
jgi:hypothetical protein